MENNNGKVEVLRRRMSFFFFTKKEEEWVWYRRWMEKLKCIYILNKRVMYEFKIKDVKME
jgi:hypothetical protein